MIHRGSFELKTVFALLVILLMITSCAVRSGSTSNADHSLINPLNIQKIEKKMSPMLKII